MNKRRLILVTSPPACGKTTVSLRLANELEHVVYLDKDTLIPLSKQIFKVAEQPYNRSSEFFQKEIRDYEYEVIVNLGLEALKFDKTVLINAPFTREIRDMNYITGLRKKLKQVGAILSVVWIVTDPEEVHRRMIKRNSDRDTWKLQNWDEYIKTVNFNIPEEIYDPKEKTSLILYYNSTPELTESSFKDLMNTLNND